MTTITRKQLVDAVEVGIAWAAGHGIDFTPEAAVKLRDVAATTPRVARGTYDAQAAADCWVGCPVSQAYRGMSPSSTPTTAR
jgi:hypothetical protein